MRIKVDNESCESNAICMGLVPEVFEVRDNDTLNVLIENPPESLRSRLEDAVDQCPKQALSLED